MNFLRYGLQVLRHRPVISEMLRSRQFFAENRALSLWGSMSKEKSDALAALIREAAKLEGPIIEVGTLFGFTAQIIASAKRPGQKLISIDNYSWNPFQMPPNDHRQFTRGALNYCLQHGGVELFDGTSEAFFSTYAGPRPALVFLDGSHSYQHVVSEIRHAKRLGVPLLCGDDYYPQLFPGVVRAVSEEIGDGVRVEHGFWSSVAADR